MGFLTSQLGVRLVLLSGSTVPLPVPAEALSAFSRLEVNNDIETGDGFQITFTLSKDTLQNYSLLSAGLMEPFHRVIIGVALGVVPEVLIDGVVTHHQIDAGHDPGSATLTVTGKDLTQVLDLEERNATYPNQPDFVIFTQLIAGYAQYGLIPSPVPTADLPIELMRVPRQQETDLKFIQRMAQRNGYVFYIEPVTFGVNKAYFGPEVRAGLPQAALTANMGSHTNVKSISFSNDSLAPVAASAKLQEPITKMSIPVPALPSLRLPPLALSPASPQRKRLLRETANQGPSQAAATMIAAVTNTAEPVTGRGEVETVRYGSVLRARTIAGVRGVGTSYDGFYYVRKVKHVITRDDYTQEFSISREGTGSLTPVVVP